MDNADREAAFARCYARWASATNLRRHHTADQDPPILDRKIRVAGWMAVLLPSLAAMLAVAEGSESLGAHPVFAITLGVFTYWGAVEVLDRLVGTLIAHHSR